MFVYRVRYKVVRHKNSAPLRVDDYSTAQVVAEDAEAAIGSTKKMVVDENNNIVKRIDKSNRARLEKLKKLYSSGKKTLDLEELREEIKDVEKDFKENAKEYIAYCNVKILCVRLMLQLGHKVHNAQ